MCVLQEHRLQPCPCSERAGRWCERALQKRELRKLGPPLPLPSALPHISPSQHSQMAKAAPSKKTAKAAKSASTGDKKKARKTKRTETFNSYIHKVLKQVHPGASLLCALRSALRERVLCPHSPTHLPASPPPLHRDWHLQEGHERHELLCQRHL